MVECIVFQSKQGFTGFLVTGHAGVDRKSQDILCAAVSILTVHTAMIIQDELKKAAKGEEKAGYFRFEIDDLDEFTEVLFRAYLKRMIQLSEQYPGKIRVEVKNETLSGYTVIRSPKKRWWQKRTRQ